MPPRSAPLPGIRRESFDEESVADQELEANRAATLKATEYLQALERKSQEKASPPVPAPTEDEDQYQDEEPEFSYHDLREQDEDENFLHSRPRGSSGRRSPTKPATTA